MSVSATADVAELLVDFDAQGCCRQKGGPGPPAGVDGPQTSRRRREVGPDRSADELKARLRTSVLETLVLDRQHPRIRKPAGGPNDGWPGHATKVCTRLDEPLGPARRRRPPCRVGPPSVKLRPDLGQSMPSTMRKSRSTPS